MDRLNFTYGTIPNMQVIRSDPRPNLVLRMVASLLANESLLNQPEMTTSETMSETTSGEFLTTLDEIEVTDEILSIQSDCSICLDSFLLRIRIVSTPSFNNRFVSD